MQWKVDFKPKRWKLCLLMFICIVLILLAYFVGICDGSMCKFNYYKSMTSLEKETYNETSTSVNRHGTIEQSQHINNINTTFKLFNYRDLYRRYDMDLVNRDVIVFLHIQKTGGTFLGKKMVNSLDIPTPCQCIVHQKKCDCYSANNRIWLFSRYSVGWICGLHADWTELMPCINGAMNKLEKSTRKRRYLYITILRDPIKRYISEWLHIRRGATWRKASLRCNGHSPTKLQVPFCYKGNNWRLATLKAFIDCPHNLANNRQTRMLANLSQINCYDWSHIDPLVRDDMMLKSAKENLRTLSYFAVVEFMNYSQMLFEDTFNLRFTEDFAQMNMTRISGTQITFEQYRGIIARNKLDIELYRYAKSLFLERVEYVKQLPRRQPRSDAKLDDVHVEDSHGTPAENYRNGNYPDESDPDLVDDSRNGTLLNDFKDSLNVNGDPFSY